MKKVRISYGIAILILFLSAIASMFMGRYILKPAAVPNILKYWMLGQSEGTMDETVLISIRLPRICMNILVGGGLALSGAAFQGVFQNPLVSPDVLSVSSGAAFGAVLGIMIGAGVWLNSMLAMGMGIVSLFITYGLSMVGGRKKQSTLNLILAGMIMSALFNALTSLMKYFADTETQLPEITYWLMGSFANTNAKDLVHILPPVLLGSVVLMVFRYRINILSLGDEESIALGIKPGPTRFVVLMAATLITASCVTATGIIGWIGLVIPHVCRLLIGPDHGKMMGLCCLTGASFMVVIDLICRTVSAAEIPIGILTAIIGAPFFALIFQRTQSSV